MKTARELYVNVFVPDYAAVHKPGVIPDFRKLILDILEAGKAADKRYTQTTLANRCNTNQANISRWSKGSVPEDEHRPLIFKEARQNPRPREAVSRVAHRGNASESGRYAKGQNTSNIPGRGQGQIWRWQRCL